MTDKWIPIYQARCLECESFVSIEMTTFAGAETELLAHIRLSHPGMKRASGAIDERPGPSSGMFA